MQQSQRQLEAAQAQVAQADANNVKAQLDLKRYTPLVEKDVISKQQFDATVATADASRAALLGAKASEIAAEDAVRIARDRVVQSQAEFKNAQTAPDQIKIQKAKADQAAAQVEQARAELAQAKLNLGYTKIVAPANGIITKKSLEVAQNVSVGQNLMTLVSLDDIWITANFKETQLRMMRPGQKVKIHVDAYGRDYDGTGDPDWGRHRLDAEPLSAGKRHWQLREGGAAHPGPDRSDRSERGPGPPFASWLIG